MSPRNIATIGGPLLGALLIIGLLVSLLVVWEPDPPPPDPVEPRIVLEPSPKVDVTVRPRTTTTTVPVTTSTSMVFTEDINELYELDHDQGEGKVLVREVRLIEATYPATTFTRSLGDKDIYHITIDTCTNGFGETWFDIDQWMFEIASEYKDPDANDINMIQAWIGVMPIVCDLVPPIYQD